MKGKNLLVYQKSIIKGIKNIHTQGFIRIGAPNTDFVHKKDITYLNIRGSFTSGGSIIIGKGCRLDVAKDAYLNIGQHSFIQPFTTIIIQHGLSIGEFCAISWNCQFLDEDFHTIQYENQRKVKDNQIIIGDRVWIGSNVSVYKGAVIGNNSVVVSHSVVKDQFEEENVLIAGNPARIIKRNISWK
jgi:acetyltransferase-like isoleucine patch superfamily enzyme